MREPIDLVKTIRTARAARAKLDQIYMVLALIETDAIDTPFWEGIDGENLIFLLLSTIRFWERKLYLENSGKDFFEYLEGSRELKVDRDKLIHVFNMIRDQGEENYEFEKFSEVDRDGPECKRDS